MKSGQKVAKRPNLFYGAKQEKDAKIELFGR